MEMLNQQSALYALAEYAKANCHSVLISGPEGCGKTYLSKQYADRLNIADYQRIEPKMDAVREAMDLCNDITNPILLCIENLDLGVTGVSYAILKFLEEPKSNVYIVVTCRNIRQIPDTIISRCVTVSVSPMVRDDLLSYAKTKYPDKIDTIISNNKLWSCVSSVADIDFLADTDAEKLTYIADACGLIQMDTSISNIVWKLEKFPDKTSTPLSLMVRSLMHSNGAWCKRCLDCLNDLSLGRLGAHAVLSRLVLELKYGE